MPRPALLLVLAVTCPLLVTTWAAADEPVDYVRQVKPLLANHCFSCHGALKQQQGLRLDTLPAMRHGGESGSAVVPGDAGASLLIRVLSGGAGFRMPPAGEGTALTDEEIDLLARWINQGATGPADERPQEDPRKHWSYQAVQRPLIPPLGAEADLNGAWGRNPIDAFVAAGHREHGLQPRPPASAEVLLRRLYLDLVGVPPDSDELQAFLQDDSPLAYEAVVERLLADPRYGQRWGRHWMDIWRYSDWYGRRGSNEIRYSQRHIWRWRDWIIDALNEDQGYDQMLVEMLAGDEVAPTDPDVLRATGFLGRNWYKFDRNTWLFETVEQTSRGILAMTMRCARCHDHKFDPISQVDYYRLRAFFEPHGVRVDPLSGLEDAVTDNGQEQVASGGLARAYDADLTTPTYRFIRGDDRRPDKDRALEPAVPEVFAGQAPAVAGVALPVEAYYPALQPNVVRGRLSRADAAIQAAQAKLVEANTRLELLAAKLSEFDDAKIAPLPVDTPPAENVSDKTQSPVASLTREELQKEQAAAAAVVALRQEEIAVAQADRVALVARIDADRAKYYQTGSVEELARAASLAERQLAVLQAELEVGRLTREAADPPDKKLVAAQANLQKARQQIEQESTTYTALGTAYPQQSSGRRLALARWMTDPQNPRTARVCVNHIWLRHFGEPLVATVDNFGVRGQRPTHPELLDWLSAELMANDWSMTRLHRLMVTSATYRLASTAGDATENLARDPANRYLWRMNSRRMEAEVVRDSLLAAAGQLDTTLGGPDLDEATGQVSRRRSLYFRTTPDNKMPLLELFDLANPNECYRRQESIVPQQALAMTNSPLALDQSRILARSLRGVESDDAFVAAAFGRVLGRGATASEQAACQRFLARHARLLADSSSLAPFAAGGTGSVAPAAEPALRARENLIHILFSHNDFVTIR